MENEMQHKGKTILFVTNDHAYILPFLRSMIEVNGECSENINFLYWNTLGKHLLPPFKADPKENWQ